MEPDWQKVFSTNKQYEAEMICGLLESAGIKPIVMDKHDTSYLFGDIELYVYTRQAEQALQIIKQSSNE